MVRMKCMTTKIDFDVEFEDGLQVATLRNGRWAYRCPVPWKGKNGKDQTAFKFCGKKALEEYETLLETSEKSLEKENATEPESGSSE